MITELKKRMMVWDSPIFLIHWILVFCFVVALLTQESERYRLVHATTGYTMFGVVLFRFFWAMIGSKHTRLKNVFDRLLKSKKNILGFMDGEKEFLVGLNAVSFLSANILMLVLLVVAATGYMTLNEIGPSWLDEIHEFSANCLISFVVIHVISVLSGVIYKVLLREPSYKATVNETVSFFYSRKFSWVSLLVILSILIFWAHQFKLV